MRKFFKTLYKTIPFKKQIFVFLRKIYLPPEKIYRHLYFKGIFNLRIKDKKFRIKHYGFQLENELFWKGVGSGWEKHSINLWVELCEHSKTILDIGANTGIYSLLAKAISPHSTVFAFEPVSRVFEKLEYNNKINSFSIQCIEKAVSDYTGNAIIFDMPTEHLYSVTVNQNLNDPNVPVKEVSIKTITLDEFITEKRIEKIDLIKIDVERHESQVLKGFSKNLAKMKPSIIIEVLEESIGKHIEDQLSGLGYIFYNIDEESGLTRVPHISKSSSYNYFICQQSIANELKI